MYVCKIIYLSILYAFTSLQAVRRVRPAFGCCINSFFEVFEANHRPYGLRYVLTVVEALILHAHACWLIFYACAYQLVYNLCNVK